MKVSQDVEKKALRFVSCLIAVVAIFCIWLAEMAIKTDKKESKK